VRDNRHESAYLFGAIYPQRAMGAAIVMPWANSEAVSIYLAEMSRQVAGARAVLVCDGAGWHQTGQRLVVPDSITLLRLPLYAPESLLHNRFRERRDDVFWCVSVLTALAKHDSIAALPRHGPRDGASFS
jgi:hypothetical protein